MLALALTPPQAINAATLAVGIAVLAAAAWRTRGRWGALLCGVGSGSTEPPPVAFAITLLALFACPLLALGLMAAPAAVQHAPGSDGWHRAQIAVMAGHTATCVVAFLLLLRGRAAPAATAGHALRAVRDALLLVLAVLPPTTLVWWLCDTAWRSLTSAAPPQHAALLALHNSAWGGAGAALIAASAILVAPLVEELVFRGVLLGTLWRATGRAWVGVAVSSLMFGSVHGEPQNVPALVLLGAVLGGARVRSGSLALCVTAHALFNARTIAFAWFAPEEL